MLRSSPSNTALSPAEKAAPGRRRFVLYVEGPSDCEILRTWARLVSPALARAVDNCSVILGGRRPARALEHFEEVRAKTDVESHALCVLDRDGASAPPPPTPELPGFEFYTWPRRHIESYLLVPNAILCSARSRDKRVDRLLSDVLPAQADEEAIRDFDAKRLLTPNGALSRVLGKSVHPAAVARYMNHSDLHADVIHVLDRLRQAVGLSGVGTAGERR